MMQIIPLGYGQPHSMSVLTSLMNNPKTLLIDTRYSPKARRPEWRKGALECNYGQRYIWAGACLGNINYNSDGPIILADPVNGIQELCLLLNQGYDLVLLCWCPQYELCHRKVIVEKLLAKMPKVKVIQPEMNITPTDTIRALSIRQPYTYMLANPDVLTSFGVPAKRIENRDWRASYRGLILLHAGKIFDNTALPYWAQRFPALYALPQTSEEYDCGGVVGIAELVAVIEKSTDPWFCGRYGFVLKNARPLPFIPYPGARLLFDVPVSVLPEALRGDVLV